MNKLDDKFAFFEIKPEQDRCLNLQQIFGNAHPVHLEIGSGRGEFLVHQAQENPEINFVAIELKEKRIKTILRQLDAETHKNVRLMKLYVDAKVTSILPAESFQMIYIIHPDPWPKRRHHSRRLIQQNFIDVLWKLLLPAGRIRLSTDHTGYADWIVNEFSRRPDFVSVYENGFTCDPPENHFETFFEKVKRKEGFPPYFMEFEKRVL
ncbi:MAG TPA: tRNA (guanosine(46)-N7)-methyltransferase TrmB [Candidatus Cloacimonadota bacterium]|nr:tRNA (guanosine(46)-N7)-methyltransferase TrmB [Candidatus Cloacimonadota bacterium]